MRESLLKYCAELETDIQNAYTASVTMEEAERLAAKFLSAQMQIAQELRLTDLDARMRRAGLKAIKATVYMEAATSAEKKPTEAMLASMVDSNKIVMGEQAAFDTAEVNRDLLQNYFNVCREAHVYFRGISKGRFE